MSKVKADNIQLEQLADGIDIAEAIEDNWIQAAGVKEITPPSLTVNVTEESYLDGDGWVEKDGGDINPGELSVTLAWDPDDTQQSAMYSDCLARKKRWYRINYTKAGVTDKYYGFISEWGKAITKGEKINRSVKFALSGPQQEAGAPA